MDLIKTISTQICCKNIHATDIMMIRMYVRLCVQTCHNITEVVPIQNETYNLYIFFFFIVDLNLKYKVLTQFYNYFEN